MFKAVKKYIFWFLLVLLLPVCVAGAQDIQKPRLIIFHSLNCHDCIAVKNQVMPAIEKEFGERIYFEYRDVGDLENYKLFLSLKREVGSAIEFKVPIFYLEGRFLNNQPGLEAKLRKLIEDVLSSPRSGAKLKPVDLIAHFKNFAPASVVIAGLEDGINPCAFTVIVFFISFLALQGYRKRQLLIIGTAFIFSVFLTYLCIGLGVFNLFYRFRGFWVITHLLNIVIGAVSIFLGILAVADFIKFKKTGSTESLALQLPKPVKDSIHRVVGFFYRRSNAEKQRKASPGLIQLIVSALITGFLVSLLEAVCTGQVYLPTIAFVLKTSAFKLQALGYLLLYNIMFIVPLVIVFFFALTGTTSAEFSGFLKKHLGIIKIAMAILFFALGIFLIWGG